MTIITADGRTIQFAGDDNDVIVDRRVADRRAFDHIAPERREGDRRARVKPEPRQSTAKGWRDNWEGRQIHAWMDDLLTRIELQVGMDHTIIHQDGTKEEVHVAELSRAANAGS